MSEESMEVRPASEIKQEWDSRIMRGLMTSLQAVNPRLRKIAQYLSDKRSMLAEANEVKHCIDLAEDKVDPHKPN